MPMRITARDADLHREVGEQPHLSLHRMLQRNHHYHLNPIRSRLLSNQVRLSSHLLAHNPAESLNRCLFCRICLLFLSRQETWYIYPEGHYHQFQNRKQCCRSHRTKRLYPLQAHAKAQMTRSRRNLKSHTLKSSLKYRSKRPRSRSPYRRYSNIHPSSQYRCPLYPLPPRYYIID